MEGWIVIKSFERLQQAQFRKALLEQNNIEAVVFINKDSAFLLGSIKLYVHKEDYQKAKEILQEFYGWKKINTFIRKKPLLLQEEILQRSEIKTMLTEEHDPILNATVYDLYVRTEVAESFLQEFNQQLNWVSLAEQKRPQVIAYYFDILNRYDIKALVQIKKDDTDLIQSINLFVEHEKADFAQNLLAELRGWTVIHRPYNKDDAEKWVDFLEENHIPALFEYESESKNFYLYAPLEFEQEATELVNYNRDWKLACSYSDFYQAIMAKNLLSEVNINSMIMTKKDSAFLLGDIELFVEEENLQKAKEFIAAAFKQENIENEE